MEFADNRPKVGVGIMIMKGAKVLLGKRKGAHGAGEYAFPGGHLKHLESFVDCARRETMEECGIEIRNIRFQYLANVIKYAPKHYIHIGLIAAWQSGEAEVREKDKAENWSWYNLGELPEPLFEMCKLAVDSYKNSQTYFDINK